MQIILNKYTDFQMITDDFKISSNVNVNAVNEIEYQNLTDAEKINFVQFLDNTTFRIFENALIFKVNVDNKNFTMLDSYRRVSQSTKVAQENLLPETAILARFEVAGFSGNIVREIIFFYGYEIDSSAIALLATIGLIISGTGANFTIQNTVPFRVVFMKPTSVNENYVFVNDFSSIIIE